MPQIIGSMTVRALCLQYLKQAKTMNMNGVDTGAGLGWEGWWFSNLLHSWSSVCTCDTCLEITKAETYSAFVPRVRYAITCSDFKLRH